MPEMPIIGRERALVNALTKLLYDTARSRHEHTPITETPRGGSFDVHLLQDDKPTGRVVRVTVELDRVDPKLGDNA